MVTIKVRSDLRKLRKVPLLVRQRAAAAVRLATLDLLSLGVQRAPVLEGILRGSGSAHFGGQRIATGRDYDPQATGDEALQGPGGTRQGSLEGTVVFNTVYAIYQHETVELNHPKGGEAKYLERPFNENRERYRRRIGEAMSKALQEAAR